MNRYSLFWILFGAGLLVGCSNEIIVRTDYDKTISLSNCKTYQWLPSKDIEMRNNPVYYNELSDKRIKSSVDEELQRKGFRLVEEKPDLIVHYHIVIEDKSMVRTDPYGYYYGSYWMTNQKNLYEYREGSLLIDLMDASNKSLVWRGWAVSILDDSREMPEQLLKNAIVKIFSQFPPGEAKTK
ncbi:MAG: DUF4136 domain-containing protein [Bacteroidetes bacterium]|nr:DUF4136 domain-containing protein [Bacteroidota bacterium]